MLFLLALSFLFAQDETEDIKQNHFSSLWGRKYQASLGYKYLAFGDLAGIQNLQITYGVWDKGKMGIYAEILFPLSHAFKSDSKVSAINLFWLYDIAVTKIFSITPKIGYGLGVASYGSINHLVWKPSFGIDFAIDITDFVAFYIDCDYSFYHIKDSFSHLPYFGTGFRLRY